MISFRTSPPQIKAQSSAHKGVIHWRRQRTSAVMLVPLSVWFLVEVLRHTQADYPTVVAWAAQPWVGAALALFVSLGFYHSALGIQVVIEDYVPNPFWQMVLSFKVKALSLALAVLSWFFIIRIAIIGNG
ncbi:MAG: hypothetical protein K0R76_1376 [Alphaproteobacteria bacterium]|nr:hypothetical protein [Alphaproteobacteria bacterium]MDF3034422.1 hypothetical protein [Alphaproteobacteria bacterium]